MTREEKELLFEENMYLVDKVYYSKYSHRAKFDDMEDIKQHGYIGLWRAIDGGRALNDDGTLKGDIAFRCIHCDMGAYIRRKINHDPRVKSKKDIHIYSLNELVGKHDGIEKQDILSDTYESAEDAVMEKFTYENFFKFFDNIDKYCNLRTKLYDIVKLRSEEKTTHEIAEMQGVNQSMISRRLKMAYNLYKDAYA